MPLYRTGLPLSTGRRVVGELARAKARLAGHADAEAQAGPAWRGETDTKAGGR
jgi:hypothetical protein